MGTWSVLGKLCKPICMLYVASMKTSVQSQQVMRPVALCFPRGIDSGSRFESLRLSTLECMKDTANSMIRSTRVLTNVRQRQEDKTAYIGKSEDRSRGGGETIRDRRYPCIAQRQVRGENGTAGGTRGVQVAGI